MPNKAFRKTLVESAIRTTTGSTQSSGKVIGVSLYSAATILLNVTEASGTSETLDVRVQKLLPDGETWHSIVAFTQKTGTGKEVAEFVSGGNDIQTVDANDLSAGTILTAITGEVWAVHWTIGGTNPSFTFEVLADFYI